MGDTQCLYKINQLVSPQFQKGFSDKLTISKSPFKECFTPVNCLITEQSLTMKSLT